MDDYQRLKIMLYQYINFKGDYYKSNSKLAKDKLLQVKSLSSEDFQEIYRAMIVNEVFDVIYNDIYNILSSFR